ncbi:MAG: efflux RND transporter periplasmic adaptor subunit [Betaproteobacteria bacterium]|nr:efflux RND transporter periplasmic adaptor subunit [Betaproteobacteria bacterium]
MRISYRDKLAITGCLLLVGMVGCSEAPNTGQQMPVLPVTVIAVEPQSAPRVLEITAQTEGAKETEVRARVSGLLMRQFYQEGDMVKAGQPLFLIDRASYENAYAEAKARADQTARERERFKRLLDMNAISRKEYDDTASADDMAQAALRQAALNLSWTNVTAPVDGITGRADKSVGNLISAGADSLLTVIRQNDPIWVRFSLSESESAKLPGGRLTPGAITGVELVLADGSVYEYPGQINFLASSIDTTLGTQQIRAEFPNPEGRLLPGQFARARLIAGEYENVYLIPQVAILQTPQANLVMLADADNKVAPRPVKLGEWSGKNWIVLGGLNPGDRVIVDNIIKLRPGNPVAPHPPQTQGQPGQGGQPGQQPSQPGQPGGQSASGGTPQAGQ